MSLVPNLTLGGAGGNQGYNLERSLRFRASATAYLNRTPASASNRTTWTWSGWVKLGKLGTYRQLFSAGSGASQTGMDFESGDTLYLFSENGSGTSLRTSQVFRDPSAWYHIVWSVDTTQATAANRSKLYVNGSQVTAFSVTQYAAQNTQSSVNNTVAHYISTYDGSGWPMDGYLAEVNFIDGQALTPSSFGETDTLTGAWKPKKYSGTYGTNGFYLPFTNTTSATTLAYDASGNGNNWTANNISTTAGVTYDSMTDVPTLTSATAANYCVLNPIQRIYGNNSVSDGNLKGTSSSGDAVLMATMSFPKSDKFYAECTILALSGATNVEIREIQEGSSVYAYVSSTGAITGTTPGATFGVNDVIGVAFDYSAQTVAFYKNGTLQGTCTGVSQSINWAYSGYIANTSTSVAWNFGQRPFSYTPPTGFVALNTFNLPDPTIKKPNQYMDATTYTGNGSTLSVTNSGSMQPDLVWVKDRTTAYNHNLIDSVRGGTKVLRSSSTDAESTETNGISSFNSNGYTVGTLASANSNGDAYVAWQWKKGATPGFDIVTWTGTGSGTTVAHNLGVAPKMMIVKNRSSSTNWPVWHTSYGGSSNTDYQYLNTTDSKGGPGAANNWNGTAPTASVISVGDTAGSNGSGSNMVAYLFAEIAGYSKFGSYTGNASTDGPFVYCGFQPRYIMTKATQQSSQWFIWDTAREPYNPDNSTLFAESSQAETSDNSALDIDVVSNGFKIRNTGSGQNNSGYPYIFMAFATNPFKYSNAR